MNIDRNHSEGRPRTPARHPGRIRAAFVAFLSLVCIATGFARWDTLAQENPSSIVAEGQPARGSATPSSQEPLSAEPAVVTIDPRQIPNYRPHRTDITDAVQDAVNSTSGPLTVRIPAGYFVISKGDIRVSRDFVRIEGAGDGQTILRFMPAQDDTRQGQSVMFAFEKPDQSTLSGAGIRDCLIVSDEVSLVGLKEGVDQYTPAVKSPHSKVAIRVVNTSLFTAENVSISRWWGGGDGSIGLQIEGRECGTVRRMFIEADVPIEVGPNPGLRWIGIDHFHFSDLFLIASGSNACVHILPNTPLTDTTFDGYESWNRGGYGLKWDGANDASVSIGLAIHNARWEQATAPGGYMIYISHGRTLIDLLLSNLNSGSQHPPRAGETAEPVVNGIYLRNVTNVTVQNFLFAGSSIGLKLAQASSPASAPKPTVTNVTMIGVFFPDRETQVDLSGGVRMAGTYVRGGQVLRIDDGPTASR